MIKRGPYTAYSGVSKTSSPFLQGPSFINVGTSGGLSDLFSLIKSGYGKISEWSEEEKLKYDVYATEGYAGPGSNPDTGEEYIPKLLTRNPESEVKDPGTLDYIMSPIETIKYNLAKNIDPWGYDKASGSIGEGPGHISGGGPDFIDRIIQSGYYEQPEYGSIASMSREQLEDLDSSSKERIDLLHTILGLDQQFGTLSQSQYRPTKGKVESTDQFLRSEDTETDLIMLLEGNFWYEKDNPVFKKFERNIPLIDQIKKKYKSEIKKNPEEGMKLAIKETLETIVKADPYGGVTGHTAYGAKWDPDKKMHYISYYDVWNLNPYENIPHPTEDDKFKADVVNRVQEMVGINTGVQIYGRIYMDNNGNIIKEESTAPAYTQQKEFETKSKSIDTTSSTSNPVSGPIKKTNNNMSSPFKSIQGGVNSPIKQTTETNIPTDSGGGGGGGVSSASSSTTYLEAYRKAIGVSLENMITDVTDIASPYIVDENDNPIDKNPNYIEEANYTSENFNPGKYMYRWEDTEDGGEAMKTYQWNPRMTQENKDFYHKYPTYGDFVMAIYNQEQGLFEKDESSGRVYSTFNVTELKDYVSSLNEQIEREQLVVNDLIERGNKTSYYVDNNGDYVDNSAIGESIGGSITHTKDMVTLVEEEDNYANEQLEAAKAGDQNAQAYIETRHMYKGKFYPNHSVVYKLRSLDETNNELSRYTKELDVIQHIAKIQASLENKRREFIHDQKIKRDNAAREQEPGQYEMDDGMIYLDPSIGKPGISENPIQYKAQGGVGSPLNYKTPLRQDEDIEEVAATGIDRVEQEVSNVLGGIFGTKKEGDLLRSGGVVGAVGFRPVITERSSSEEFQEYIDKYGKPSGLGLSPEQKAEAKKLGLSEWQYKTGSRAGGGFVNFNRARLNPQKVTKQAELLGVDTWNVLYDENKGEYYARADAAVVEEPAQEQNVFEDDLRDYVATIDYKNIPKWKPGDPISEEVKTIQEGLVSIYGEDVFPTYGIDGKMGDETINALNTFLTEDTEEEVNITDIDGGVDKGEDLTMTIDTLKEDHILAEDVESTLGMNVSEDVKIKNIKEVQQSMIDLGAYLGPTGADGDWGPRSKQAYKWYMDGKDLKDFKYKSDDKVVSKKSKKDKNKIGKVGDRTYYEGEEDEYTKARDIRLEGIKEEAHLMVPWYVREKYPDITHEEYIIDKEKYESEIDPKIHFPDLSTTVSQ